MFQGARKARMKFEVKVGTAFEMKASASRSFLGWWLVGAVAVVSLAITVAVTINIYL